ncbi:GFA family protein [Acidithiobacillus sp.]|uniref:GFA family protein n=1 Tax=Acidithiobacillus sp. TaxID=1872118 RepID=UPI0032AF2DD1
MNAKYSGKCLCGKVSYSVNAEPMFSGNCHCKDCQRSSGSAFIPAMIFREKDVDIIGEVKYFESQADSGDTHSRGFCPNCGSQLFARFSGMAGALGVKAGTLDDSSNYAPNLDFYVGSAAPWDFMDPQLPKKQGAARG